MDHFDSHTVGYLEESCPLANCCRMELPVDHLRMGRSWELHTAVRSADDIHVDYLLAVLAGCALP